ncbi:MAG: acyltransferase [Paludibacter sp.]|nr:acyltransferase [Paludibacter sp.]
MKQNNFNFLRFYFAFIVVIGHLIEVSNINAFHKFAPFFSTYISVTAFFCISGFLISRSYLNTPDFKDYLKKRAARLLPAYVFIILTCAIFLSFMSKYSISEYFTNPLLYKYLASNLTFLNFIQPCLPGVFLNNASCAVNGALWTLKIEVSFYLIIPVLLYFTKKIKKKHLLFIGIYLLSVMYRNFFEYLSNLHGLEYYSIIARQLPGFMSYFVCGIALYYYFDFFIQTKKTLLLFGLIIFIMERILGFEFLTPLALSVIIFFVAYSFKRLNNFTKHGDISYGIYIFHYPIMKIASEFGFFEKYNPVLVSITIVLLVLLVGFASWHLIEKRFLKITHSTRVE